MEFILQAIGVGYAIIWIFSKGKKYTKLYFLRKEMKHSQKALLEWQEFFNFDQTKYGVFHDTKTIEFVEEHYKAVRTLELELGIGQHTKEMEREALNDIQEIKNWVKINNQNEKNYWDKKNS